MNNKVYVFDACAFIEAAHQYNIKKKQFQGIWNKISEMFLSGEIISSIEVFDELGDDDLVKWIKPYKNCFKPLSKEVQDNVTTILKEYPGIINIKKNKKSSSNGDPFLIATAMCENGNAVIVTNENTTKEFGIPKISSKYNINSINLRQFIEENFD